MRNKLTTLLLFFVLLVGLSLLLYPSFSDYWNSFTQSRAIASYADEVAAMDEARYARILNDATYFNAQLNARDNVYLMTEEQQADYEAQLNVAGDGIMGYVEIPSINCSLPIYHGTSESVLQMAIGHLEWTSLPVGGEGTHCAISGHRGLPSARLFTDLDQLREGDVFILRVLNEILTYEVDKISIVEPDDTKNLLVEKGKDYCTMITCTPYGINSHRLLVRGHRIENAKSASTVRVTADALQIEPMVIAPIVMIPILIIFMSILLLSDSAQTKKHGEKTHDK